jgi:hypothetical protein
MKLPNGGMMESNEEKKKHIKNDMKDRNGLQ